MEPAEFRFESRADGLALQGFVWRGAEPPRGVVVVAHELGAHARQHDGLAERLVAARFEVRAFDLRGHGRSPGPLGLGDFGPIGWAALVDDLRHFVLLARAARPRLPLALVGQGLGADAARELGSAGGMRLEALALAAPSAVPPTLELRAGHGPNRSRVRTPRADLPALELEPGFEPAAFVAWLERTLPEPVRLSAE